MITNYIIVSFVFIIWIIVLSRYFVLRDKYLLEKNEIKEERESFETQKVYLNRLLQNNKDDYEQLKQDYEDLKAGRYSLIDEELQEKEIEISNMRLFFEGAQKALLESKKEDKAFNQISISDEAKKDLTRINIFKKTLSSPTAIDKAVWSFYFQKEVSDLCARVLGPNKVCGIYLITNVTTSEKYVGQSVDVAKRWKEHCKCGLGIDASPTNKLYNSMQTDGLWNFSFELLDTCEKDQLNYLERKYIDLMGTNVYGFNMTKGNN